MIGAIAIKSPKATKIKAIHVDSGSTVGQGDLLLELYDHEEQKLVSTIERAIAENEAKRHEVQGTRVTAKIDALIATAEHRQAALEASHQALVGTRDELEVGSRTIHDVIDAEQDVALHTYQVLQSAVEAEIFSRNCEDAKMVYALVSQILMKEKNYVERSAARLRLAAPRDGRFRCFVSIETPVRIGHLLGEID